MLRLGRKVLRFGSKLIDRISGRLSTTAEETVTRKQVDQAKSGEARTSVPKKVAARAVTGSEIRHGSSLAVHGEHFRFLVADWHSRRMRGLSVRIYKLVEVEDDTAYLNECAAMCFLDRHLRAVFCLA